MPNRQFFTFSMMIAICAVLIVASANLSRAEQKVDVAWKTLETKYTLIHYQSMPDLKGFSSSLKYSREQWGIKRLFASTELDGLADKVKSKVDAIVERVQEILDMRKKMKKLNINVYHNKTQLNQSFHSLFNKECRIRAWYIYEFNTVYVQINDLHTGMLAHEIAHAIIDHFLEVRPPAASAEILARYVDSHILK